MPSPIGERLETFPIGREVTDTDPSGKVFLKTSSWQGSTLLTVARDPTGKSADYITRRHLDEAGHLVQVNEHNKVSFQRLFERKT